MRIDAYNKIAQVYQTSPVKKTMKTNGTSQTDQLNISRTAKDYQVAKQAVADTADIRTDKVNEIKKRLESGTYHINMEEVADKVINSYFEKKI